jgi:Undecaprenyl-phosphate galactose phosphotransferase WbaP
VKSEQNAEATALDESESSLAPAAHRWRTGLTFVLGDVVGLLSVLGTVYFVASFLSAGHAAGVVGYALPLVLPALLAAYAVAGLYGHVVIHPALEMQRSSAVTGAIGVTAGLTVFVATGELMTSALIVAGGLVGAVVMPVCRGLVRILFGPSPWWGLPAAIVSSEHAAAQIVDTLRRWPEIGLRPVAHVEVDGDEAETDDRAPAALPAGVRVLPESDGALRLSREADVPYVILALPEMEHGERSKMLAHYSRFFDHVFVVGDAKGSPALWTTGRSGEGLFGYGVRNFALQPVARLVKRCVDLAGSVVALALLSPVFGLLALLIKTGSDGPVFYRQQRMGREGRVFTVLKFRTMYLDAHEKLEEILATDPARREEYERYHKLQDDPRVTSIGRVLRRFSLDELPQVINVLFGEMSLVGPRAYMPGELPKMKGLSRAVLQTPPGITGLWQVSGRNRLSFETRVDLDVHYIQNWSPWLDLYLLVRTFPVVLSGKGAS